jgi:hypothetical protein
MSELEDLLGWLERWYHRNCDDDLLEQDHRVTIQTIDNPGWLVEIKLPDVSPDATDAERILAVVGDPPSETNGNIGGTIWMKCIIDSGKFVGAGDPTQLRMILTQFKSFVEAEGG